MSTLWTDNPEAQAILSRVGPHDLHVAHRVGLGRRPDRFVLCGEVVLELEKLRVAATELSYGCTFLEAEKHGEVRRWVYRFTTQPEPEQVLAERFGDPNRMGFRRAPGSSNTDFTWTDRWRAQFPARSAAA